MSGQPSDRELPRRLALFTAFLKIGVLGFGGVAALARHVLVVERRYLDDRAFAEAFGVAATLPGANTVNLATMLGFRWRGWTGSAAALGGLLGTPLVVLVAIAALYARFSYLADVRAGLAGAAATAAGLVVGTALKLLKGLDPDVVNLATAAACLAAAVLGAPMLIILCLAIPLSIAATMTRDRRAR